MAIYDNEYLYGKDIEVPEIDALVIARRIELLKDNFNELIKEHYLVRDADRCNAIQRAIEFWESIGRTN